MGTSEADGLREKMVELVRKGVSPDKLLEMLTIVPAAYLGIADRVGTLEPGKQADFIVTRGDLFTDAGKPLFTVVAGKRFDIKQMAASPKRIQTASDGVPYRNIAEDDADGHGDGGVR
jgi:imidazolonepropionase-like amidohydrolase